MISWFTNKFKNYKSIISINHIIIITFNIELAVAFLMPDFSNISQAFQKSGMEKRYKDILFIQNLDTRFCHAIRSGINPINECVNVFKRKLDIAIYRFPVRTIFGRKWRRLSPILSYAPIITRKYYWYAFIR